MSDELVDTLRQLAAVLLREEGLGANLGIIAQTAARSIPGCDAASIALNVHGRPATAGISAAIALEVDMVQYATGEGPCLSAYAKAQAVRLDLVEPGSPFPHFAVGAAAKGIRSVLSVPALRGDDVVGTLNIYSRSSNGFDDTSESIARVLAAQIAIAISRSPEFSSARSAAEQAQRDADDHADIALATGLLMGTEDCTAEQADGLLRHAADEDHRSVLQIAHRIIEQARYSR